MWKLPRRRESLEKTRLAAARTLLIQIVGVWSIEDVNSWDLSTIIAALPKT